MTLSTVRDWMRDDGLLIANVVLFLAFSGAMVASGVRLYNSDQVEHGQTAVSLAGYLSSGDFVEATFENWESEFLAVAIIVGGSVYLRHRGSAESKPVAAAHRETGS